MQRLINLLASLAIVLAAATCGFAQDPGWPRQLVKDGNMLVIYQPQVDDWKEFAELEWRMAVSLTPAGEKPAVGIVVLKGDTQIDNDQGMVQITNLQIVETKFPSLEAAQSARMDQLTRTFLPPSVAISLQRLVACVPKKEKPQGVQLKHEPPQLFVSYQPAILLDVDGDPVRAKLQDSTLEYVVNTHWPLFFDTNGGTYYLPVGDRWLTSPALQGPWKSTGTLPKELAKLPDEPRWAEVKKVVPPSVKPADVEPAVYFSTVPSEVLLFNGKPTYAEIPGTRLKYATNTTNYLFLDSTTTRYYLLTAGRWFRADSLAGPWSFATPDLPADFAKIPRDHPAAQVLASVPGTEEAEDAVLMAQIPTTAKIDPAAAAAAAKVAYDGAPKFAPVEGTTLYYATNTAQKVIRVGDLYYLCLQGIWFVSASPQGPWQTAPAVPPVIYTIPPSSPVYNVTYVTQTTTADGVVYSSYTSGYSGVYVTNVSSGVVITSGTGYYYPPYVAVYPAYPYYPVYYPPPYTYGASSYYNSATGTYGVSQTAYGEYGTATRAAAYNPYTGTSARAASVSTAYGSAAVGEAYNPYTGAYGATKQGSNAYASWGSSAVTKGGESAYSQHYTTAQGSAGSVQSSSGGKAYGASTQYGSTAVGKTSSGDMYAGHDGNVYKNTGSGWEKYGDDGNWSSVQSNAQQQAQGAQQSAQQRAQASGASKESFQQQAQQRSSSFGQSGGSEQMQHLQQESQNRQRGEQSSQRSEGFQQSGSHGFGGGGQSWGGGGHSFGGGGGFGGGRGGRR